MGSCDQWGFPLFSRPQWQSLSTALTAGKCLPLGLCKGTVKESSKQARNGLVHDRQYTGCLVSMDSGAYHGLDLQTGSCNADNSRPTMPWAPHEQLISKQGFFLYWSDSIFMLRMVSIKPWLVMTQPMRYTQCRHVTRADHRFAPSQWDTSLQSNTISHWLGTNLESALCIPPWDSHSAGT